MGKAKQAAARAALDSASPLVASPDACIVTERPVWDKDPAGPATEAPGYPRPEPQRPARAAKPGSPPQVHAAQTATAQAGVDHRSWHALSLQPWRCRHQAVHPPGCPALRSALLRSV